MKKQININGIVMIFLSLHIATLIIVCTYSRIQNSDKVANTLNRFGHFEIGD